MAMIEVSCPVCGSMVQIVVPHRRERIMPNVEMFLNTDEHCENGHPVQVSVGVYAYVKRDN